MHNTFLHFDCSLFFDDDVENHELAMDRAEEHQDIGTSLCSLALEEAASLGMALPKWSGKPQMDSSYRSPKPQREFAKHAAATLLEVRFGTASARRVAARAFVREFDGRPPRLFAYAVVVLRRMIDKEGEQT